jgi:hypothetical protein
MGCKRLAASAKCREEIIVAGCSICCHVSAWAERFTWKYFVLKILQRFITVCNSNEP